jgi:uncharacterized protein YxjI
MNHYTTTFIIALALLFSALTHADESHNQSLSAVMHERLFTLSTYYDIDSDKGPLGNVIKTKLSFRTTYQYYDQNGQYLSCAYQRIFSLGSFYTWACVMDIYDGQGNTLGLIEGSILTLLPSKFSFYDATNNVVGVAYMDKDCMGFSVFDPTNETRTIANFRRVFVEGITDYWTMTFNDLSAIDSRILFSFAAFALDKQADFREDN